MTQSEALNILKTGANVFLTGEPGSGKTHTVNEYVRWLRSHGVEPAITASTGIAATHISGQTIHAWSGIGINDYLTPEALDHIAGKEHVVKRIQKTSVLIIDEVSMLSGNVLTMVDQVTREVRRRPDDVFGGLQVVLVGDFFQLPPISKGRDAAPFAFESSSWDQLNPIVCYLTEQHRQDDENFLELLSSIRGSTWDHSHISYLLTRETDGEGLDDEIPRLFTHNADVDRINNEKLEALPGNAKTFAMDTSGSAVLVETLKRGCLSPETLKLKEGAVVMCTKNNPAAGYVNGTLGIVIGFERGTNYPMIETRDGEELTMVPAEWVVEENGKPRAKLTQIPLRLAWAITIHKSQGMSMDAAAMDLSRSFEYGQGYVALSRVRSLEGIYLLGWHENALMVHPQVARKDSELREASDMATVAFADLEESGERQTIENNFITASGGKLEASEDGERLAKRSTYDETLALIEKGMPLEDIAKERSLTLGTICDHVARLAESGRIAEEDVYAFLPTDLQEGLEEIHAAMKKKGSDKLAPVFGALDGRYSYDELKLARLVFPKS